ncbi:MAG: FtsW/RodA/SpoVE family cell cycle protein [Bacteroidales bacterium]|nr:FtsW/RodA/SpoVE family cell cycle protein [Bacteroidales bacterium]MBQ5363940.1 FtsW/RodA/SpoVE family cell cycle protein [Bacteroidales bacterium]
MADKKRTVWNFFDRIEGDKVVWIIVLMLILISIVCIFSSTSRLLEGSQTRLDIVKSQLFVVAAGLALIIVCYNIKNIKIFRWLSQWGALVSFVLLGLLLTKIDTPIIRSIELNGARRILQIAGFQVHVFEVVKVAMVLYLAWAMDALKKGELKWPKKEIWKKILFIYFPFVAILLMILPGSNSAALFIGGIMFIVILLGGGNLRDMALLAALAVVLIAGCWGIYEISGHKALGRIGTAVSRLSEHEDWEQKVLDARPGSDEYYKALDKIRQPYSAKIAIKEGGVLGKGPGQSTQRYVVPDISEDYMYSFIIEEYGLWGALIVIFLYVSLLARGSIIVRNCGKDIYAKISVAGLCLLISGQAFLHMFVNADIGPMTGQTLPLISHGNSAFLCFSLAFGLILSFSRIAQRRIEKEQREAQPLIELKENVQAGLDELDSFESGEAPSDDILDEMNDYGVQ